MCYSYNGFQRQKSLLHIRRFIKPGVQKCAPAFSMRKTMSGIEFAIKNLKEVKADLQKTEEQVAKAVNATTSDFAKRGPGWISQEVIDVYAISQKDIKKNTMRPKYNGKICIAGLKLNNVEIKYKGRLLTITHFKMTPKKRPKKSYRVSAEIKKGNKARMPKGVFLGGNGGGKDIPFQREGKERLPIRSVKSLSVPQMVTNKDVSDNIQKRINTELEKRLDNNLKRYCK